MNPQLDLKITEIFKTHAFTLSAEIIPPRNGSSAADLFAQVERLISSGIQYFSVTKGAGGSLRGGSLPIAQSIKDRFRKPCIAHFTCRDLLPEDVENQLMDHHLFGIRNVLALRGDPPDGVTNWHPREGSHQYAYRLIEQIAHLNDGRYLERQGFPTDHREKTQFCIGAAAYPDHADARERREFFELKVKAGAEYAITQMLFDADSYARFLDETAHLNVPILPGTRLLKSQAQALRIAERFQVPMPKSYLAGLPEADADASPEQTLNAFFRLTERLRAVGAPGLHLFVLSDFDLAAKAINRLANRTLSL